MAANELAYDVEVGGEIVGYTHGPSWGGLVYDPDGFNVVGAITHDVGLDLYYLRADQPHHTGKALDGQKLHVSNRPSKKFKEN